MALVDRLPLDRVAYVHVAGGTERAGLYHDTHTHPVPAGVLDLLARLADRVAIPGMMLERDGHFPPTDELDRELDAIAAAAGMTVESPAPPPSVPTPPSVGVPDPHRHRLAAEQAALVNALVDRTPAPPRFDTVRLQAAGIALAVKRAEVGMTG